MSIRDRVHDHGGILSRLKRYPQRGWVAGVCVGLGEYFDWNVKVIRLVFFLGLVFSGFFPVGLIYIALWYLMDAADVPTGDRDIQEPAPEHDRHADRYRPRYSYASASPGDVKTRFSRMEQRLRSMEECVASKDFELRRELKKLES